MIPTRGAAWAAFVVLALIAAGASIAAGHDRGFDTRVRITGYVDNTSFLGRVASDRKQCKRKRRVTVWRRNPGAMDAPVGIAKSNGNGIWAISAPSAPAGSYYATVKQRRLPKAGHRHVCRFDRSKSFEL